MLSPPETFLHSLDPDWARLIAEIGPCRIQLAPQREPYEALVRAVAHQQLHGKAAEAMLGRLLARFPDDPFPTAAGLAELEATELRACGFSAAKTAAIQGIARAALDGVVPDRATAAGLDDEELIRRLTSLRGIGRWTVEMFLIFTLARPDILPVDDFGVREGYRVLKGLDAQPKARELARLGQAWSPYRSSAAWYLWRAAEKRVLARKV